MKRLWSFPRGTSRSHRARWPTPLRAQHTHGWWRTISLKNPPETLILIKAFILNVFFSMTSSAGVNHEI